MSNYFMNSIRKFEFKIFDYNNLIANSFILNRFSQKLNYVTSSTVTTTTTNSDNNNNDKNSDNNKSPISATASTAENSSNELDDLIKKLIVHVRGHDPSVLTSYEGFVKLTAKELDLNLKEVRTPARFIERWTLLKSRFSKRKHMRQYEMRTYFKEFEFIHLTGSTCDTLLEYIQRNLPEGVAMHVHKTKLFELPEHLRK